MVVRAFFVVVFLLTTSVHIFLRKSIKLSLSLSLSPFPKIHNILVLLSKRPISSVGIIVLVRF